MVNLLKAKSKFRAIGINLIADKTKSGGGGSWKFASEDNLIRTIQQPLVDCGLEIFPLMKKIDNKQHVQVILFHTESGESISTEIELPDINPKSDKNGNKMYLDAEIERGKQFGYWSRMLTMRILGLSDIDPEDHNNKPQNIIKEDRSSDKLEEQTKKKIDDLLVKLDLKFTDIINSMINSKFIASTVIEVDDLINKEGLILVNFLVKKLAIRKEKIKNANK